MPDAVRIKRLSFQRGVFSLGKETILSSYMTNAKASNGS